MERTHLSPREKVALDAYRELIGKYLPAILIKCTKFTNSKRLAEIIARFTFEGAYHLSQRMDGSNKIPVVIESMLNIVGPNYADGPKTTVGEKLFEEENALQTAKKLAVLDIDCLEERCAQHTLQKDVANGFDRHQFERITESVIKFLTEKEVNNG